MAFPLQRQLACHATLAVGTVLVLGLLPQSSALAASASTEPTTASPASTTELPDCSLVDTGLAPLSAADRPLVTKISGGGRKYSYALPGGSSEYMTVNEPPTGFDPLIASDAELQLWGFPPRPSNSAGLERWRELVGNYKEAPLLPSCHQTQKHRGYLGESLNYNWSGWEDTAPGSPNKWHAVIGTFYQPYGHGSSCAPGAAVASWVGLGGDHTNRFMQTGTEATAAGAFNGWIEIFAGEYRFAYEIPSFPIEGGNYIRLYAGYNRSLEIAYFYITNDHTGQTVLTEWHIGPQFYDGSSAEWIDESPGGLPLLNFGEVNWYSNQTQNGKNEVLPIDAAESFEKDVTWRENNHRTMWPLWLWNHENYTDLYYACR
ncbi:MAG TPA: G1 family glutamic endopeptidase [Solirubrobacterales bacterium]|nr:G1 family glutamic endopeptidase [Solirubrobacterales bacterium]